MILPLTAMLLELCFRTITDIQQILVGNNRILEFQKYSHKFNRYSIKKKKLFNRCSKNLLISGIGIHEIKEPSHTNKANRKYCKRDVLPPNKSFSNQYSIENLCLKMKEVRKSGINKEFWKYPTSFLCTSSTGFFSEMKLDNLILRLISLLLALFFFFFLEMEEDTTKTTQNHN